MRRGRGRRRLTPSTRRRRKACSTTFGMVTQHHLFSGPRREQRQRELVPVRPQSSLQLGGSLSQSSTYQFPKTLRGGRHASTDLRLNSSAPCLPETASLPILLLRLMLSQVGPDCVGLIPYVPYVYTIRPGERWLPVERGEGAHARVVVRCLIRARGTCRAAEAYVENGESTRPRARGPRRRPFR